MRAACTRVLAMSRRTRTTPNLLLLCAAVGCGGTIAVDDASVGLDGGATAPMDARVDSAIPDASAPDAPGDTDSDVADAAPAVDADLTRQLACDSCGTDQDCVSGHVCTYLLGGERACLPTCEGSVSNNCPYGLGQCKANQCHPGVSGRCCVDADGDGYGRGEFCPTGDLECDDSDPNVHRFAVEVCNGRDDDCDGRVDQAPTTCQVGTCIDLPTRSEATPPGVCAGGICTASAPIDCGLYRCDRAACATACADGFGDRDELCAIAAHCDSGLCRLDLRDGETCDEDSDCASGFCTGSCGTSSDPCVCETRGGL